jgi:WD40 repeat protein/serine/threonine protein kinase
MGMAESRKLRSIFDEVLEIPDGDQRRVYLDEVCRGDPALRLNIEELLRTQKTVGEFLADPKRDAPGANDPVTEQEGARIGRYKLLQKIGEGGCGLVYMADQLEPVKRRVALKILKLGMDTRSVVARFAAERQALALMDHPGIARVLDAGATDTGRPFFVMELVHGIKITDYCEQHRLSTVERLHLFVAVCHAVQHAHQKGIIHRDLKPSNILVTSDDGVPLPKVIDFGIAKATADIQLTDKTLFTRFELFIGTPAYMSPEQAEFNANDIDTRTDIYALGVLLYELLTDQTPFDPKELMSQGIDAMRKTIRETEPLRPSTKLRRTLAEAARESPSSGKPVGTQDSGPSSNRLSGITETIALLRGDLDWIVMKCLEKDRRRRYETANGLAADIQRHLRNEPVTARPLTRLYLLGKWIRRNRSAFAAVSVIAFLLVTGIVFATWEAVRTRRAARAQRELREKAEANQRQTEQARNDADAANRRLTRTLFLREWQDAEDLMEEGKTASALAWFARAAREHPADFAVQTRLLSFLTENTFAMPLGRPFLHGAPVTSGAFSSDGQQLVTAAGDGLVRVWSIGSATAPLVLPHRFSGLDTAVTVVAGDRVLVDDDESVSLWEMSGAQVKKVPLPHLVTGPVRVTADGRFAALNCGDGGSQLWDTRELRPMGRPILDRYRGLGPAAIDPEGRWLLGIGSEGWLCAWDTSNGQRVWQLDQLELAMNWIGAALAPDSRRVIVSAPIGVAHGELSEWRFEPNTDPGRAIWKRKTALSVLPRRSRIVELTFSRSGDRLFTGDLEGHIGTIEFATREGPMFNAEHDGRVTWLGLSADGQQLATTSVDGTARLWDVRMKPPEPRLYTNGYSIWQATFSPDSRLFALAGNEAVEIRDTASGELRHRLPMKEFVSYVDFSPDGRRIVAGGDLGATRVWDTQTGKPVTPMLHGSPNHHLEFSPDGRWFLIVTSASKVLVHETETGRQVGPTLFNDTIAVHAHFSPDGRLVVVTTEHGGVEFWSVPDGRRLEKPVRHKDVVWTAQFSPDGTKLLTASRDRTAALWDVNTGRLLREFHHDQEVYTASFSPDGRRILTGDANHLAYVWDVETGRRLFGLLPHPGGVWHGEFSRDGRVLITGDDAGNSRLWEAATGLPMSGWIRNGPSLKRARLSPDGRHALSAGDGGTVRVWPVLLCPLPAPPWLPELAEAVAGRRLREDGVPESVPVERWKTLSASLGSLAGDDIYARWARWFIKERLEDKPALFEP